MIKPALLILEDGTALVAYTDELDYEPKCHLWRPHSISGKTKVVLSSWPPHAVDEHVLLGSSRLMTVCEPEPSIIAAYTKKVGKPPLMKSNRPTMLTEEETILEEDDYEPEYIEE